MAFLETPDFWVLVAFVLLFAAFGRMALRTIVTGLDDRAESIRNRIEEAQRLRDEAQEILASYQRKQREAAEEAKMIVEHAKTEAERLAVKAAADLEASLKRRESQALERIARAEAEAMDEVRFMAADLALDVTRRILVEQATGAKADKLVDAAIGELPDKLH